VYLDTKCYLEMSEGNPIQDVMDRIFSRLGRTRAERLGYPTQKPLALLERIIQASSNEGDTLLDPFCGCGTAIVAAQKLNRRWIGIDITHLAIALIKYRLSDMFNLQEGHRTTASSASQPPSPKRAHWHSKTATSSRKWAIGLIPRARPYQDKKGKDTGIDGVLYFKDDLKDPKRALIQVKSGKVGVKDVRDFRGVLEREGATLGLFVSLEPPTREMVQRGGSGGFLHDAVGELADTAFAGADGWGVVGGQGFCDTECGVVDGCGAGGACRAVGRAGVVGDVGCCSYPQPLSLRGRRGILLEC
jgi:site-specific DNA-methyltransferase (adenine-specific)